MTTVESIGRIARPRAQVTPGYSLNFATAPITSTCTNNPPDLDLARLLEEARLDAGLVTTNHMCAGLPRTKAAENPIWTDPETLIPVFCDWLSLSFAADLHESTFDRYLHCEDVNGVRWRRPAWVDVKDARQDADEAGSASTNIRVRWNAEVGHLHITGNLGRWMKRDNVWGQSVTASAWRFLDFLQDWHRIEIKSAPTLTRVDLTANIAFQNAEEAMAYVQWCTGVKLSRIDPRLYPSGVAWATENWSAKVYDKIVDLRRHGSHALADNILRSLGYLLRLETTLRTDELNKHGLSTLQSWNERPTAMNIIFSERFKPLLNPGVSIDERLQEMPYRLRAAFEAYRNGTSYPAMLADGRMSRATYYRLRKGLLPYGVDISQPVNVTRLTVKPRQVNFGFVAAPEWYSRRAA